MPVAAPIPYPSLIVGNPDELLTWLQGSGAHRTGRGVAPEAGPAPQPSIELDHVGSVENAAKVISALHRGEKRLVFCDSRRRAEQLGTALRAFGVTTFLSHASLSLDERRRAEQAFADARDCVIVATSTLELGIDVGDLDLTDQSQRVTESHLRLRADLRPQTWRDAVRALTGRPVLPEIDDRALHGLKFSTALPRHLAEATLAARLADIDRAEHVLTEPHRFVGPLY